MSGVANLHRKPSTTIRCRDAARVEIGCDRAARCAARLDAALAPLDLDKFCDLLATVTYETAPYGLAPAIAAAMGVSLSTVNRAHMAYDSGGIKALKPKPNGGRQRENMTLAEEKALLARFAKAAGAGEMLNIHDLKAAYEKAIGHATSDSTVYNLLHRHGWRKLMPRPHHPKRDLAAQSAFKKSIFLML
jgi:transposase